MPFTIAHVAVIYPFRRLRINISTTAFITGTIVPDVEGFFMMRHIRDIGHQWIGIFLFDIPLGLVLCYLFHHFVKLFLLMNSPGFFRQQYLKSNWSGCSRNNYLLIIFSLLMGILSHFLLDGFTHRDGLFIHVFPLLLSKIVMLSFEIPVYFFLQIAFSIIGLFIIIKMILVENLNVYFNVFVTYASYHLTVLSSTTVLIFLLRLFIWPSYDSSLDILKCLVGAFMYSLLLISFIYRIFFFDKLMAIENKSA